MPNATARRFSAVIAFSIVASPFVAYSIHRTGYEVRHLADFGVLTPASILLVAIGAIAVVGVQRWSHIAAALAGGVIAAAFAACHAALPDAIDYKLWVYIVAPRLVLVAFTAVGGTIILRLATSWYPDARA